MTLPEVLIAMVITSVVTTVLLMGMVTVYRAVSYTHLTLPTIYSV